MSGAFGDKEALSLSIWNKRADEINKKIHDHEHAIAKLNGVAGPVHEQELIDYQLRLAQALRLSWQWRCLARFCDLNVSRLDFDDDTLIDRAIVLLEKGIRVYKEKRRVIDNYVLESQLELAILLNDYGEAEEALDLAERTAQDKALSSERSSEFEENCAEFLSRLYLQADNKDKALAAYEQVVGIKFTDADKESLNSVGLKEPLIKAYEQCWRLEQTNAVLERTILARRQLCDSMDPFLYSAQAMRDELLAEQDKCKGATLLLEHVLLEISDDTIRFWRQLYYDLALRQHRTENAD